MQNHNKKTAQEGNIFSIFVIAPSIMRPLGTQPPCPSSHSLLSLPEVKSILWGTNSCRPPLTAAMHELQQPATLVCITATARGTLTWGDLCLVGIQQLHADIPPSQALQPIAGVVVQQHVRIGDVDGI